MKPATTSYIGGETMSYNYRGVKFEDVETVAKMGDDIADMEPGCDYSKDYIKGFNDAKAEWLKQHAND